MERAELKALVLATGCAEERGGHVFLCDPRWNAEERTQLADILAEAERAGGGAPERGWLCVPSGGTSGRLKFARHDERTLSAAVLGFCAHFGLTRVNAVDVLPPHHVSGLMARVRCAATGGRHLAWNWKELEAGRRPELSADMKDGWVLSLVPTQLQRLLVSAETLAWMRQFRVIFIGGGPIWTELMNDAARAGLPVSVCYGMTETAAMVAALKPVEFAEGARSCGSVMPHARVEIIDDVTGTRLPEGEVGLVRIAGPNLFCGYFPDVRGEDFFRTEDLGRFTADGHLQVLGRRDAVIITGGKKVFPAEVEDVLRASGEFEDVAVIGVADADWGQRVVACFPAERMPVRERVEAGLEAVAAFKRPKQFLAVADWPRNAQGKVNRDALKRLAQER